SMAASAVGRVFKGKAAIEDDQTGRPQVGVQLFGGDQLGERHVASCVEFMTRCIIRTAMHNQKRTRRPFAALREVRQPRKSFMLSLQPAIESANLARRVGVILGSVLVTFYYSSKVVLRAAVG